MKFPQAVEAGYKVDRIRAKKRKNDIRTWIKRSLGIIIVAVAIVAFIDYLSRVPRERHARDFTYFEKVKHGAKKTWGAIGLNLAAFHEDPQNSRLPIFEIYISGKRLDKLKEDLPESGTKYQKADVKFDGKEYKAQVRYRGDSINHWAYPQKSWRVQLTKGKFYKDMQILNLNVPRVKNQLSNWLGYEVAKTMGNMLVPHSDYVHFRLNRQYDGVRLLLEQPNQDFLTKRNLPNGKIFVGDIDSEHIYGGVKRKHIYKDSSAWEIRQAWDEPSPREMVALLRIIREEHNPYEFYRKINSIVDMDSLLHYMAMLELVGSVHVDETHNGKYYFNPVSGKFSPIVWDTVAYFWGNNKRLDLSSNSLFRVVLSNPEFRERKDRILWNAIDGELSTSRLQRIVAAKAREIQTDIYSFALKLHANDKGVHHISNEEWDDSVKELINTVESRNSYITQELAAIDVDYKLNSIDPNKYLLGVQVNSRSGFEARKLRLKLPNKESGIQVKLARRGLSDIGLPLAASDEFINSESKDGIVEFILNDTLLSKRRFANKSPEIVPATYVYEINVPSGQTIEKVAALRGINSVTGKRYAAQENLELKVPAEHKINSVWWSPNDYLERNHILLQGDINLTETVYYDSNTDLTIASGTTVKLSEGASIIIDGGVLKAEGTPDKPINILPASEDARWGVIGVRAGELSFNHVNVKGGSESYNKFVQYLAPLSLHNAKGTIKNSSFTDNFISLRSSELEITDSRYTNNYGKLIRSEGSVVKKERIKKNLYKPIHSASLLKVNAFGTAPRIEREFKHSIVGENIDQISLEDISDNVNEALNKAVEDKNRWHASKLVGEDFYADESVADFMFRDIYFDTADHLNYKAAVSYRLRNRFTSMRAYKYHVKRPTWSRSWPYRLEFQAKTDRKEVGDGYSTVAEARFEVRRQSSPFSEEMLPPPPPWDLDEYIPYFQSGSYKGMATYPAQEVMKFLVPKYTSKQELEFLPELVLLTDRYRQHLNIKTLWGSGPNPEQSYIISLDKTDVYEAEPYLEYLHAKKLGVKGINAPTLAGSLMEIEIEFERNVSNKLDQEIEKAKAEGDQKLLRELESTREAFIADQKEILEVVSEAIAQDGLSLVPAAKSKYVQAYELTYGT